MQMHAPADTLTQEIDTASRLLEVLAQEQSCLAEADAESVGRLTGEKARLVAAMAELAHRRHRALAAAGFAADETGMQRWAQGPASPAAKQGWARLLDLAREARELNRTNGLLINQQLARTQTALNVLQGDRQGGKLYGPNGQATGPAGSRSLVVG
jgi:flagella synthesis protein FlgN